MDADFARARVERQSMVGKQLARRGIEDQRVLAAMGSVPREEFVPAASRAEAYADRAVALAADQTVSQPWIVAAMSQALTPRPSDRALEVGTGSGYSAAVLAQLVGEVISIERLPELAELARTNLARVGVENVEVVCGDGSIGLAERGPYDAIAVHAAMPSEPQELLAQLRPGGRLVAPVSAMPERGGGHGEERLTRWQRDPLAQTSPGSDASYRRQVIAACRFVPLIGVAGYAADSDSR
jgi:protein-L-isoaspartate(D-aspartate) O-methyltransferase